MSQSLPSTLSTQDGPLQPSNTDNPNQAGSPMEAAVADIEPVTPVKRGPGRPKGSGMKNKFVDPNAPPPVKRPVGRPRKDGLPAGSVPRPASINTRKRKVAAPGSFAASPTNSYHQTTASASAPPFTVPPLGQYFGGNQPSFQGGYNTLSAALQAVPSTPELPNTSVTRSSTRPPQQSIDSPIPRDDWANLSRTSPNALVESLITALHAPHPISRTGFPVEEAFRYHVAALGINSGVASYYSTVKTFWLPCSPAYFCLTASASTPTPPEYRFLYWDPQQLVFNGITCPHCSAPLANRGIIRSGPIKVYDLGKPFYIIGSEYHCSSQMCKSVSPDGRKFSSTDPLIMRSLPAILRDELPAQLLELPPEHPYAWHWEPMGVSKTIWNMVRTGTAMGVGKDTLLQLFRGSLEGSSGVQLITYKREEDTDEAQNTSDVEMHIQSPANNVDGITPTANGNAHQGSDTTAANYSADAWKSPDGNLNGQPEASTSASTAVATGTPTQVAPGTVPPPFTYAQGAPPYMPSYGSPYPYIYQPTDPNAVPSMLKRAGDTLTTEPSSKRIRHCVKCGSKDCKGKGGRNFCTNACQDCGATECKGRNSKRPDKTCADAWS